MIQRMGILFVLSCLLGFTINMTDALENTLTMVVCFSFCIILKIDCLLCNRPIVPRRSPCSLRHSLEAHETNSHCHGGNEHSSRLCMDRKYIRRTPSTISNVMDCDFHWSIQQSHMTDFRLVWIFGDNFTCSWVAFHLETTC